MRTWKNETPEEAPLPAWVWSLIATVCFVGFVIGVAYIFNIDVLVSLFYTLIMGGLWAAIHDSFFDRGDL